MITQQELHKLYILEKLSTSKIAKKYGTYPITINRYLRKYNIPIRNIHWNSQEPKKHQIPDKKEITKLYSRLTKKEIAKHYQVSRGCVDIWFRKLEIKTIKRKTRTPYKPIPAKDNLNKLYIQEDLSIDEIGILFKVSSPTVRKWLRNYNITVKSNFSKHACQNINSSKLESKIERVLLELKIMYKRAYALKGFIFDFFIPSSNTLLEIQGRYWHADPRFYTLDKLHPLQIKNRKRDKCKKKVAELNGFNYISLWEDDINSNKTMVISTLMSL